MSTKFLIMTLTIILGLTCFTTLAQSQQQQEEVEQLFYNMFKDWITKNSKQYGVQEMPVRYSVWKNNYDFVQQHNSKNLSWELEVNRFADLTPEEFSALHLGLNLNSYSVKKEVATENSTDSNTTSTTPSSHRQTESETKDEHLDNSSSSSTPLLQAKKSVDWRSLGAVTYVKDQGSCGACWSFSASGALEGLHAIKYKKLVALSEQQLIDCSGSYGTQGCNGGDMVSAFTYTEKDGIETESNYPYTASQGSCSRNSKEVVFRNKGYKEVPQNSHLALKSAVSSQPVSVGIEASSQTVQLFKSGIISGGCSTDLDHGVLIVGYGTASNQDYWIVKNSWGSSWGLDGYMHIAVGSENSGAGVCGINMMASYPTL